MKTMKKTEKKETEESAPKEQIQETEIDWDMVAKDNESTIDWDKINKEAEQSIFAEDEKKQEDESNE